MEFKGPLAYRMMQDIGTVLGKEIVGEGSF